MLLTQASLETNSPAFLCNNVQYCDGVLCFTDQSKMIFCDLQKQTVTAGPKVANVKSFRYVSLNMNEYLVVCGSSGTEIFTKDGSKTLSFHPIKDGITNAQYHKGCCAAGDHLLVIGGSDGSMRTLHAVDQTFNEVAVTKTDIPHAVGDINYCAIAEVLICAHDNGAVSFWTATSKKPPFAPFALLDQQVLGGHIQVPTGSAVVGVYCFVAFGNGSIRGWNCMTRQPECLITAHARWITGIDCVPADNCFCSVAEDTVLNVWRVKDPSGSEPLEVQVEASKSVVGRLLTGACFRADKSHLAVVAYEADQVYLVDGI
eukprot:GEMP01048400.1.p1 GENE.GEMP01048400.1~~GEMP01048400.1.p1  ORF type:complete len:316 (+),score=58.54 GEMP01048400.1:92-1039(+)